MKYSIQHKTFRVVLAVSLFGILPLSAFAQSVGVSATGTGYASPGTTTSAIPVRYPYDPVPPSFIQFNNLTVQSVSATNPPAEIIASGASRILPMMGTKAGGTAPAAKNAICLQFSSSSDVAERPIPCPNPSGNISATTSTNGAVYPLPPTPAYRIEITSSTQLYLRDRTVATLASFTAGDQINVYGYYNADGTITAYLVRDLSKPVQDEFLQLNNVTVASVSGSTTPATVVVAQEQSAPCYGFNGNAKNSIVCPMGVTSPSIAVPQTLAPNWISLRKYSVQVTDQTIILDSNRTRLSLTDLHIGDVLNIYGDSNDNSKTINADIVRDLSIPAKASTYSGTITTVNTDGSFVVNTDNGQTITVQSPIQTGMHIQVSGVLNTTTNILSSVTRLFFGNTDMGISSGMLRIKGGLALPPEANGAPNTRN